MLMFSIFQFHNTVEHRLTPWNTVFLFLKIHQNPNRKERKEHSQSPQRN